MKKIGMFYGTNTVKTALVAKEIKEAFGDAEVDVVSVESAAGKEFEQYDNLIVGAATCSTANCLPTGMNWCPNLIRWY